MLPVVTESLRAPLARLDGSLDMLTTVVAFGLKAIVRTTEQAQIFWLRAAALAGGMLVVELQPSGAVAAFTGRADPTAAESIALEHLTSSGTGDRSWRCGGGICRRLDYGGQNRRGRWRHRPCWRRYRDGRR